MYAIREYTVHETDDCQELESGPIVDTYERLEQARRVAARYNEETPWDRHYEVERQRGGHAKRG